MSGRKMKALRRAVYGDELSHRTRDYAVTNQLVTQYTLPPKAGTVSESKAIKMITGTLISTDARYRAYRIAKRLSKEKIAPRLAAAAALAVVESISRRKK